MIKNITVDWTVREDSTYRQTVDYQDILDWLSNMKAHKDDYYKAEIQDVEELIDNENWIELAQYYLDSFCEWNTDNLVYTDSTSDKYVELVKVQQDDKEVYRQLELPLESDDDGNYL